MNKPITATSTLQIIHSGYVSEMQNPNKAEIHATLQLLPSQINKELLDVQFLFKEGSKLKQYIDSRSGKIKGIRTLAEILTILIKNMISEGQYNKKNVAIFTCSEELEAALEVNMFHSTEAKKLVIRQLVQCQTQDTTSSSRAEQPDATKECIELLNRPILPIGQGLPLKPRETTISSNSLFCPRPKLLAAIRTLTQVPATKIVFKYAELQLLLSEYMNQKALFIYPKGPTRNPNIAIIRGDLLAEVFGMDILHKCQLHSLLLKQLVQVTRMENGANMNTGTYPTILERRLPEVSITTQAERITPAGSSSSSLLTMWKKENRTSPSMNLKANQKGENPMCNGDQ